MQPDEIAHVPVEVPGTLRRLHVREGEPVRKGKILAEFSSLELEKERTQAAQETTLKQALVQLYDRQISGEPNATERARCSSSATGPRPSGARRWTSSSTPRRRWPG